MKTKTFLLALVAVLFVLPSCNKNSDVKGPSDTSSSEEKTVTEVNEFTTNLNTLEGYLGKSAADVVASLQKEGYKSAAESEGSITAADTISGVICVFSASCGTSGNVNTIDCVYSTTETKSYVDNVTKLSEAIQAVGQNHNLPSGNALTFNSYAYDIKDQERQTGYDWNEMVTGLSTIANTYNAVFNWKNSSATYGLLSIVRKVSEGTTSVNYKLQDRTY